MLFSEREKNKVHRNESSKAQKRSTAGTPLRHVNYHARLILVTRQLLLRDFAVALKAAVKLICTDWSKEF